MHENTAQVNTYSLGSGCHASAACFLIARVLTPTKSAASHLGHKQHHPLSSRSGTPSFPRETQHPGAARSAPSPAPANPDAALHAGRSAASAPLPARAALRAEHRRTPRLTARIAGSARTPPPPQGDTEQRRSPQAVRLRGFRIYPRAATPFLAPRGMETAPLRGAAEPAGRAKKGTGPSEPSGAHVPRHRLRNRLRLPLLPAHLPPPGPAVTQLRCWELLLPRRASAPRTADGP